MKLAMPWSGSVLKCRALFAFRVVCCVAFLSTVVVVTMVRADEPVRGAAARAYGPPAPAASLQGGTGANFDALISLIENEIKGNWQNVDGGEGTIDQFESGVRVDPQGVLSLKSREDRTGQLAMTATRIQAAADTQELNQASPLRVVSLARLEQAVATELAAGRPLSEAICRLAGLNRVQFVFVLPEERDILLAGPAFGLNDTAAGTASLHLEDLVTVLRTFGPQGRGQFGCSIDPRQDNLRSVHDFVISSQAKGPMTPAGIKSWAHRIEMLLGQQDISIYGVPAHSRVARVLVEADYRMKLIGVGKLAGGSGIPSYFDLLAKQPSLASGGLDAMRWWMTLKCDAVVRSPNGGAYEIRGSAVQCLSENQFLTALGERVSTGQAEPINQQFAENFTQRYEQLAQREPVFADLQGIFDLALVAALIQRDQLDQRSGWERGAFALGGQYQPARHAVPKSTASVVNYRVYNGKDVVLQAAGGVKADLVALLKDATISASTANELTTATAPQVEGLPEGRWWWDAR